MLVTLIPSEIESRISRGAKSREFARNGEIAFAVSVFVRFERYWYQNARAVEPYTMTPKSSKSVEKQKSYARKCTQPMKMRESVNIVTEVQVARTDQWHREKVQTSQWASSSTGKGM